MPGGPRGVCISSSECEGCSGEKGRVDSVVGWPRLGDGGRGAILCRLDNCRWCSEGKLLCVLKCSVWFWGVLPPLHLKDTGNAYRRTNELPSREPPYLWPLLCRWLLTQLLKVRHINKPLNDLTPPTAGYRPSLSSKIKSLLDKYEVLHTAKMKVWQWRTGTRPILCSLNMKESEFQVLFHAIYTQIQ